MTRTNKQTLYAAVLATGLATFATAAMADCAADLDAIQQAIASGSVDASLADNAKAMWTDAKQLMDEGKEAECVEMTTQIKASLGIN